jgi:uncharacterized protein (DUF1015 family)
MPEIKVFRALRYDAARVDVRNVVCPPYDVLSPAEARVYRSSSPYNAIHLDMPSDEEAAAGEDRYAHAAAAFVRWQREGVLVRDEQPALYLLEQHFRGPDGILRSRRGFVGRLRLEEFATGVLRPHESTNPGPRRDRLALLRASHANLSPLFLLHSDESQRVWRALAQAERPCPPLELGDRDGTRHILQPAVGPHAAEAASLLGAASRIIADGHHRYETALAYCHERRALGDHSADFCMAYFCGMDDPGLAIFPAHRLLTGIELPPLALVRSRLAPHFDVVAEIPGELTDPSPLLDRLKSHAPAPVFGLVLPHERLTLVVRLRGEGAVQGLISEGLAPAVASLPVTILHRLLLRDVFGLQPDGSEGVIEYFHRPEEALERLRAGDDQLGAFLNAPTIEDVRRVAGAGQTMPQKATYFFPKLLTGLLFNPLDET